MLRHAVLLGAGNLQQVVTDRNLLTMAQALGTARALRWVAAGLGALAALAMAYAAGSPARPPLLVFAGLAAFVAACTAAVPRLNALVQSFYFVDYVHQDKK